MLNTYFKIGDYLCRVDRYDRETGLWGYSCDEVPVLNGWACEKFIREFQVWKQKKFILFNMQGEWN